MNWDGIGLLGTRSGASTLDQTVHFCGQLQNHFWILLGQVFLFCLVALHLVELKCGQVFGGR